MVTRISKKKRKFKRQDYHRYKKLKKGWRRPRGRHSKLRKGKSGNPPKPKIGYGAPKKEKGFVNGKKVVFVNNLSELNAVEKSENIAVMISSKIGLKKLEVLFKKANELGLSVMNTKRLKKIKKRAKLAEFKKIEDKKKKSKEKKIKEKKSKQLSDKVETEKKKSEKKGKKWTDKKIEQIRKKEKIKENEVRKAMEDKGMVEKRKKSDVNG